MTDSHISREPGIGILVLPHEDEHIVDVIQRALKKRRFYPNTEVAILFDGVYARIEEKHECYDDVWDAWEMNRVCYANIGPLNEAQALRGKVRNDSGWDEWCDTFKRRVVTFLKWERDAWARREPETRESLHARIAELDRAAKNISRQFSEQQERALAAEALVRKLQEATQWKDKRAAKLRSLVTQAGAELRAQDEVIEQLRRHEETPRDIAARVVELEAYIALHPYGACTCAGEGQCGWCLRSLALEERATVATQATAIEWLVDSLLRLVSRATQEEREGIAAEIARLDGGGVRLALAGMAREALGDGDGE